MNYFLIVNRKNVGFDGKKILNNLFMLASQKVKIGKSCSILIISSILKGKKTSVTAMRKRKQEKKKIVCQSQKYRQIFSKNSKLIFAKLNIKPECKYWNLFFFFFLTIQSIHHDELCTLNKQLNVFCHEIWYVFKESYELSTEANNFILIFLEISIYCAHYFFYAFYEKTSKNV